MPTSNKGTDILKQALLESYKEGCAQGFLVGQKEPVQNKDDVFLKCYAVSQTKTRIDELTPTDPNKIILKS